MTQPTATPAATPAARRGFYTRALRWLREEQQLSTQVVPSDRGADPTEPTRVPGGFNRPSRAGAYGITGLWVFTAGLVLAMLGMPGLSAATKQAAQSVGQIAELCGAGLVLWAAITLRRHRDPALIELRPAPAGLATAASVTALHRDARGVVAWIVAEQGFEPAALTTAAELGVRCFVPGRPGMVEVRAEAASAAIARAAE